MHTNQKPGLLITNMPPSIRERVMSCAMRRGFQPTEELDKNLENLVAVVLAGPHTMMDKELAEFVGENCLYKFTANEFLGSDIRAEDFRDNGEKAARPVEVHSFKEMSGPEFDCALGKFDHVPVMLGERTGFVGDCGNTKETNPKDAVGVRKWRQFTTVPMTVMAEVGVAMLEGARKYGKHNYRVAGVRASVYVDAAIGHMMQFWEGEDIDKDSGLSHVTKAITSLVVLRDAMIQDMLTDDRPPRADLDQFRNEMQKVVDDLFERYPDSVPAFTEKDNNPF